MRGQKFSWFAKTRPSVGLKATAGTKEKSRELLPGSSVRFDDVTTF